MTPKERVMTALRRGQPDQVPWVEAGIDEPLQIRIMGGRTDYTPGELCRALGMDGFGCRFPSGGVGAASQAQQTCASRKESFYFPKKINFDFTPPWIAEMGVGRSGRSFVKKGLLIDRDSLKLFDEFLPDPDHPARYEQTAKWIEQYREDYAVFARIRLGSASVIESMRLDVFSLMLYDDPDLVKEIHRRFSEWSVRVIENLAKLDLDYTLTLGTPEEVDREVKERIAVAGKGGGYIISSANSLAGYCKTENVWAMSKAVKTYGKY